MKPFGYVILIALFSLGPLLFLLKYLPNLEESRAKEKLEEMGVVLLDSPVDIDFSGFIDHRKRPFGRKNLEGKWTFAYFGFTRCPDFCPTTMFVLGKAEQSLNKGAPEFNPDAFQGALFTIDPTRDLPEDLGPYVATFSERFVGVWSDLGIDGLARKLDIVFEKVPLSGDGYMFDHTSNIVILGPDARYYGYIRRPHKPEQIAEIFKTLQPMAEAKLNS
tara:strand:- start:190 stop:846 length:657 start_codon:yes stop_codon:yes gene_type:complete